MINLIDTEEIKRQIGEIVSRAIFDYIEGLQDETELKDFHEENNFMEIEALGGYNKTFKAKVESDDRYGISPDSFAGLQGKDLLIKQTYAMLAYNILKRALMYTPVNTGELRKSSYIRDRGVGYEVGFTAEYAVYVHEIGDNKHVFPTRYKFLEDAAYEVLNEYTEEGGSVFPLKITYNPLAVYIGDRDAPGFFLASVKLKEDQDIKRDAYKRVLYDFYNFDRSTATKEQLRYYNIALEFFDYYMNVRFRSKEQTAKYFSDRMRHYFLSGSERK